MAHSDWYDLYNTLFSIYRLPIDRTQTSVSSASEPTVVLYKSDLLCSLQPYSRGINDRIDVQYDRLNARQYYTLYCDVEDYADPYETDLIVAIVNRISRIFKIIAISNQINYDEVQKLNLELQPENTIKIN